MCLPRIKSPENPILSGGFTASQNGMMADFTPREMSSRRGNHLQAISVRIKESLDREETKSILPPSIRVSV